MDRLYMVRGWKRPGLLAGAAMVAAATFSTAANGQTVATEAVQPVASLWTVAAADDLLTAVKAASAEGLDPRDYGLVRLEQARDAGQGAILDAAANASAIALARDYAVGRIADRRSFGWMIDVDAGRLNGMAQGLQAAIVAGEPRRYIEGLLPSDRRYQALRAALAEAPDRATRDRLRANMERWRWMPRELGQSYIYVNVPSYRLKVVDGGDTVSSYDVVVGAVDTPTPQLVSPASSLVVNPWWNVPQSIVKSANLRPGHAGYLFKASANGGYAVRQPPGPRNALGKIKINLVNDQAIYLHDTPAKAGFTREARALSHGCIRVKDIDRLAAELIGDDANGKLETALVGDETATLRLARTWQVYLVYFTADADDGGTIVSYGDPYGRDAGLIAKLDGDRARNVQIAAR